MDLSEFKQQSKNKCVFCEVDSRLLVMETKNFQVLYDPFPLVEGHLMITSKLHYGCAGELDLEHYEELSALKNKLAQAIKSSYGDVAFYEHGRAGTCLPRDGEDRESFVCHHFHLHALPVTVNVHQELKKKYGSTVVENYSKLPWLYMRYGNYIYSENSEGEALFFCVEDREVPSHLMRTLISKALLRGDRANWEDYSDAELLVRSIGGISL